VWTHESGIEVKRRVEAYDFGELNPNSPKQILAALAEEGLQLPNTKAETLEQYVDDSELCAQLVPYRKDKKLWEYFERFPELMKFDGRIHTWYGLGKSNDWGGTSTGRTSSRDPNLQNIPSLSWVRGCFAATPGYQWLDSDYSQLELRVVADLAQDKAMLDAFAAGWDMHTATLSDMFNMDYEEVRQLLKEDKEVWKERRRAAKIINFGILYGMGGKKLAANLGISVYEAEGYIAQWLRARPGVVNWLRQTEDEAVETGEVVAPTGQKRRLWGASRKSWIGWRRLRQATNYPVQHFASTILMTAMLLVDEWFQTRKEGEAHLLLNVHDQLAAEFKGDPEDFREEVEHLMTDIVPIEIEKRFGYRLSVPLEVDSNIGQRWS
jgi:DNA polymerase-1